MKQGLGALAVLAALTGSPALADGPDPAVRPHPGPGYGYAHRRHAWHRHRGYRGPGYSVGSYGAPPAYGMVSGPSEYTEAYIGRGLVYNTPPEPYWPSTDVISVRY